MKAGAICSLKGHCQFTVEVTKEDSPWLPTDQMEMSWKRLLGTGGQTVLDLTSHPHTQYPNGENRTGIYLFVISIISNIYFFGTIIDIITLIITTATNSFLGADRHLFPGPEEAVAQSTPVTHPQSLQWLRAPSSSRMEVERIGVWISHIPFPMKGEVEGQIPLPQVWAKPLSIYGRMGSTTWCVWLWTPITFITQQGSTWSLGVVAPSSPGTSA